MIRLWSFSALLALAACSSALQTPLSGVSVSQGGERRDHITWAPCIEREATSEAVAIALPLLLHFTAKYGYASREELRKTIARAPIKICLVEEPMPCCAGGWPCAPPCKMDGRQAHCARKSGCSTDRHVWIAKFWPPVCRSSWPDEPHCVALSGIRPVRIWQRSLVHELGNVLRQRVLHGEGYDADRVSAFFASGGPVHSAQLVIEGLH